jgi:DNA replication protein DnaC
MRVVMNNGRVVSCPRCSAPILAAKRIASLWAGDGLAECASMTFDNFVGRPMEKLPKSDLKSLSNAKLAAIAFAADPIGFLVFTGPNGVGKTHLAAAIANEVVKTRSVLFTGVVSFLDHLRDAFNPAAESTFTARFDAAINAGLLVLDDMGAENGTAWANERLFEIINRRYMNRAGTVITTNLPIDKLPNRVASRLSDTRSGRVVEMVAPDIRPNLEKYASLWYGIAT